MGIIEISVAVIALAFVCLVYYLTRTLTSLQNSLKQVEHTMVHMQAQIDEVTKETTELIRNTNVITQDIQKKSKSFDSVFQSIQDVGQSVEQITQSMKQVSSTLSGSIQRSMKKTTHENQDKISEWMNYATLGLNLVQKWQARKGNKENKKDYVSE